MVKKHTSTINDTNDVSTLIGLISFTGFQEIFEGINADLDGRKSVVWAFKVAGTSGIIAYQPENDYEVAALVMRLMTHAGAKEPEEVEFILSPRLFEVSEDSAEKLYSIIKAAASSSIFDMFRK